MYQYPYGDSQQLNLDWLVSQWQIVKNGIDQSLQAEIDRVEAAIADLLNARDQAVAAAASANSDAGDAHNDAAAAHADALAAAGDAADAATDALKAEGYAVGEQNGAAVGSGSPYYHNNAEYYANEAASDASDAHTDALAAAGDAADAATDALKAEGYAVGEQNGSAVSSGSPYYHNNAKYYANEAASDASDAHTDAQAAQTAATLLQPPATAADVGKALIVKTVSGGTVTAYELGESGGGGGGTPAIVNTIENVPIASFDDGTANPVKQIVVGIEPKQSGSGDPAPDNVRPITGWTGANVTRTGKNLFDADNIDLVYSSESNTRYGQEFKWAGKYAIKAYGSGTSSYLYARVRNANGTYNTSYTVVAGTNVAPAIIDLAEGQTLIIYTATNLSKNDAVTKFKEWKYQVAYTDTQPSSYEAYSGTTIPITFPDAAGTVYGGTLTINEDGSGVLAAYPYYGSYNGETLTGHWISDRDVYAEGISPSTGAQVLNDGGTPTNYNLTSQQVIAILDGVNNVWADTGNIIKIQYYADSKTYIDEQDSLIKALITPVLDDMVADTALVVNDFRIVDNTLYKITTSVAAGAALTPNTNCTATTIGAVLKTLLT